MRKIVHFSLLILTFLLLTDTAYAANYSPIPNIKTIYSANPLTKIQFTSLGSTLSVFYEIALYITITLSFIWLTWGVFQYILAGGNKESLGHARSRITWAIIGLLFVVLAYLIAQFAREIIQPRGGIPF